METYEELKKKNFGGGFPIPETGMAPDYINAWMGLGFLKSGIASASTEKEFYWRNVLYNKSCWRKVPHYEDYLREKNYPYIERRIADSDKKKVEALNKLADIFNAVSEQLKMSKNVQTAIDFFDLASLLIRGS